eukprot:scaffold664978_cov59-Prasinocladus_malaysianus.AAC.1
MELCSAKFPAPALTVPCAHHAACVSVYSVSHRIVNTPFSYDEMMRHPYIGICKRIVSVGRIVLYLLWPKRVVMTAYITSVQRTGPHIKWCNKTLVMPRRTQSLATSATSFRSSI